MVELLNKYRNLDLQRTYKWRLTVRNPIPGADLPTYLHESATFPLSEIQAQDFQIGGGKIMYPEFATVNSLTLDLYETSKGEILRALQKWKDAIQNSDGTYNYPEDFKRTLELDLLTGENKIHTTIILEGAWPTTTNSPRVSYAESEKVIISQEFAIDRSTIK